jgi:Protein of unknown function (DUF3489)
MANKSGKFKTVVTTTKSQILIALLKRPKGASIPKLAKATNWQAHSVRGFLSGTLKKKQGLVIASTRDDGKDRRYRIEGVR